MESRPPLFDAHPIFGDIGCVSMFFDTQFSPADWKKKNCARKEIEKMKEFNISFQFIQFWSIDKESIYGIH